MNNLKLYDNFITDLFKTKTDAKKFTKFLIDFINSVIITDKVKYQSASSYSHCIAANYLEEYVIEIEQPTVYSQDSINVEFCELYKLSPPQRAAYSLNYDLTHEASIIEELSDIQEFIKMTIRPISIEKIKTVNWSKSETYKINISDLDKVMKNINKEEYEVFQDQKKYNL